MTEIILTSSVLILLLAVLRRALRGRIDPRVQYALWLLVAARLLIPGTLFTAPVSVMGTAEEVQTAIRETFPDPRAVEDSSPAQYPAVQPAPAVQPSPAANADEEAEIPIEKAAPLIHYSRWDLVNWLDVIWKAGMLAVGSAMAASNLIFYLRLRKARRRLDLPAALRAGKLPVYEAEGLSSPCLFGLLRPAIYLNEAAVSAAHPEHILAHEYAHYRHGDQLWSILRSICLVIHWYNPLVWWAAVLSRRDCELACDASVLRRLGEGERIDYGQTLLGMISRSRNPAALLHTATTMSAGKRAMTERIALIAKAPRARKITLVLAVLLACVLAACAFGGGEPKAPEGTEPSNGASSEPASAPLLEFPGLHWNDSVETVIRALGIQESQILEQGETDDSGNNWGIVAENLPAFGGTAEKAYFYFERYEGSEWGLYSVRLDYPNDASFGAVREELLRQYGPGGDTAADSYIITGDGDLQSSQSFQTGSGFSQMMLDLYGQEMMDRRAEILEQPGPHSWHWSLDSSVLPEKFAAQAADWLAGNAYSSISPETAREYFRLQPMVRGFWTDAAPLNWSKPSTTSNQICLDASEYVYFLQRIGRDSPTAVTVSQSASSNSNDTSYITDPEEVARLWELYQSFEYEGSYDPAGTGGWPIGVSFHYGDSPDDGDVFFILDRTGISKDGEHLRLKDIDEIYAEFLRVSEDPAYPFGPGPARDVLSVNARSIVEQVQQGTDVSEWLPLMNYMDWSVLARAAVEAGLGEGDGSDATTGIMATIDDYIARQGPSMTQAEYLYILSATTGLDGAPAESYSFLVYRMHAVNPSQFAYAVLYELPEEQKNTVLDFFRYEYRYEMSWEHEPFDGKQGPSREEAIAQLERELEKGVSASPEEMLLTVSGESFQFLPVNAYGIYATTYASSNPYVADVTDAGTVTARGEGEADITMHFEGAQGQHDLVCHVLCELSGGSEAVAASIRTYIQNGISPKEWLPFLLRTSWADIAVPWTEDGWRDWIMDAQQAIYLYILNNGNSLTDEELLTIMSATKGLDGAYAEGYASILYTLYNLDPKRFAVIALDDLSGEDQDTAVMLLRYGWSYDHAEDYDRPYQERQAAMLAQLEEDKKGSLSLRPDAVAFYSIGEVRSLHIVNDGDAAVRSCESSDPEIVAVRLREDGSFELQAVGPGEALVTVHCTIGGEEQELTCSVLCAW